MITSYQWEARTCKPLSPSFLSECFIFLQELKCLRCWCGCHGALKECLCRRWETWSSQKWFRSCSWLLGSETTEEAGVMERLSLGDARDWVDAESSLNLGMWIGALTFCFGRVSWPVHESKRIFDGLCKRKIWNDRNSF